LELQRLALFTGNDRYLTIAEGIMKMLKSPMERSPLGFGHLLGAVDLYTGDEREVVVVGDGSPQRDELLTTLRARYLPNAVVVVASEVDDDLRKTIPLLEGRGDEGQPTAYVCRNGACLLPVTTGPELERQLDG
jgi:uncharacterized protein YyaL (SSP411 family)